MTARLIHERMCAGTQKHNCCTIHRKALLHPLRLLTQHARRSAVSPTSPGSANRRTRFFTIPLAGTPQCNSPSREYMVSIWRGVVCGVAESYESSVDSSEEQPHSVQSRETLGENRDKSGKSRRKRELQADRSEGNRECSVCLY